jgi:hypothetical protein
LNKYQRANSRRIKRKAKIGGIDYKTAKRKKKTMYVMDEFWMMFSPTEEEIDALKGLSKMANPNRKIVEVIHDFKTGNTSIADESLEVVEKESQIFKANEEKLPLLLPPSKEEAFMNFLKTEEGKEFIAKVWEKKPLSEGQNLHFALMNLMSHDERMLMESIQSDDRFKEVIVKQRKFGIGVMASLQEFDDIKE